jgi:hypothetical protein
MHMGLSDFITCRNQAFSDEFLQPLYERKQRASQPMVVDFIQGMATLFGVHLFNGLMRHDR